MPGFSVGPLLCIRSLPVGRPGAAVLLLAAMLAIPAAARGDSGPADPTAMPNEPQACTTASFSLMIGGFSVCDSGTTGTTACGQAGGTCPGNLFYRGNEVGFVPACSEAGTGYFLEWGDGSTTSWTSNGTAQGRTHVYTTIGPMTVRVTVNGTLTDLLCIEVLEAVIACPTADFSSTPTARLISFSNQSTNYTTVAWAFGDGATSTQVNPSHLYASDGSYDVTLTVTRPGCTSGSPTAVITKTIEVLDCTTPGAAVPFAPSNGATGVEFSAGVNFGWGAGSYNDAWDLQTYSGAGCSTPLQLYQNLASPSYLVPAAAFAPATVYSWRVTPKNLSCTNPVGPVSACQSFSTRAEATCTALPAAPSLAVPAAGATGVSTSNVNFSWEDLSTPGCAASYRLALQAGSCQGALLAEFTGLTAASYIVGALPVGTTIAWTVTASNQLGTGPASACRTFDTAPDCAAQLPGAASPVSPAAGSVGVPNVNTVFTWSSASCAGSYDLRVFAGSGCGGAPLVTAGWLTTTSRLVPSLPPGSDLSWNVRSRSDAGTTVGGCASFQTGGTPIPPPEARISFLDPNGQPTAGPLYVGWTYTLDGSSSTPGAGTSLVDWRWDFGDGWTANGPQVPHSWGTVATFVVSLTVTQDDGKTDLASQPVSVVLPPSLSAAIVVGGSTCWGGTTQLDSLVAGGMPPYTRYWDLGDGSGTTSSPSVSRIYANPGSYLVQLSVVDALGASTSVNRTVAIASLPPLPASALRTERSGTNLRNVWVAAPTSAARPVDGYTLFRASSPTGTFATRGTTPPNVTQHVDFLAWLPSSGPDHYYAVGVTNGCGTDSEFPSSTFESAVAWGSEPVRIPLRLEAGEAVEVAVKGQGPSSDFDALLPELLLLAADRETVLARAISDASCPKRGECGGGCDVVGLTPAERGVHWIEIRNFCPQAGDRKIRLLVEIRRTGGVRPAPPG